MRPVEPWPQQRDQLRQLAGTDEIPVLQAEDGRIFRGTREIFAQLETRAPWRFAVAHRRRFEDRLDIRESDGPGQLVAHLRGSGGLESAQPRTDAEAMVVNVPDANHYELMLDGRRISGPSDIAASALRAPVIRPPGG